MNNNVLIIGQIYAKTNKDIVIYENCINQLKKLKYKIMVADNSVCQTKFDYLNLCDYYLYDKENRLFSNHKYNSIIHHLVESYNITLLYHCLNHPFHELNILYTIYKTFNLAKLMDFKYVVRFECDVSFKDDTLNHIKNKIEECIKLDKKAVLCTTPDNKYMSTNILFCDVDWFLSKTGNIKTESDWFNFLKINNLPDDILESTLSRILLNNPDEYLSFGNELDIRYVKGLRYKETKRFSDSQVYLDFFKSNTNEIYFAVSNMEYDSFPKKLFLTQFTMDGIIGNEIKDPGENISWVVIDSNLKYLKLQIDDQIITLTKDYIFSTKNIIQFN